MYFEKLPRIIENAMIASPLVSIMMPAFNAGRTIRFALASLIAQTFQNWECIVVDDGSSDDTAKIAQSFFDSRIRVIRLEKNQGRGFARQRALDEARGDFIAMLDADDWIYPDKLQNQVEVMLENEDVSLVSCGMAIMDREENFVGIRGKGSGSKLTYLRPGKVPVAHAPSMIRASHIGKLTYDARFRLAQDVDFLRRFLFGRRYVNENFIGYSYSEIKSARLTKILSAYTFNIRGMLKFFTRSPFYIGLMTMKELAKLIRTAFLGAIGFFDQIIKHRSRIPTESEKNGFNAAKLVVERILEQQPFARIKTNINDI
jgi:glycosyltransferase involved in cell wall biosynthesis